MRKTTKLMLALSLVGSLALTSCKDYTEEEYSEVVLTVNEQLKKDAALMAEMQQQISDLAAQLEASQCTCDGVSITDNGDGTYTIRDSKGNSVTVPATAAQAPGHDEDGYYIYDSDGNKIYIPQIVTENGKKYIKIGDQMYEFGTGGGSGSGATITIEGDKITITSGDQTWEFDKTTAVCGCTVKVEYDADKKVYTISDGTNPAIEVPAGKIDLSEVTNADGDNLVTITIGDQTTTLKKVTSEVSSEKDADGNDVIVIQHYNADGTKNGEPVKIIIPKDAATASAELSAVLTELYGEGGTADAPKEGSLKYRVAALEQIVGDENGGLVKDVADVQAELADIDKALYGEDGTAENPAEGSILARLNNLEIAIADLTDALKKLVTGVIVDEVVNPAFGSYSSLVTNLQTTMLVAYHGEATQTIKFPSIDPQAGCSFWAGDVTIDETAGNAGAIYAIINPNTVDFSGLKLELVNSNDEACGIVLEPARKTTAEDPTLKFGYTGYTTRSADNNGLYVLPATLSKANANNDKLNINLDKNTLAETLTDFINIQNRSDLKPVMKDIAQVVVDAAQSISLDKQGIKCSWTDANGEHSVYSKHEIAAVAFKPLGFYTVDGIFAEGGKYWRGYDKAKKFIEKYSKKIGKTLVNQIEKATNFDKISADLDNIVIDSIDYVVVDDGSLKMHFTIDTTMVIYLNVSADVDISEALEEIQIPNEFGFDDEGNIVATGWQSAQALKDQDAIKVTTSIQQGSAGDPDTQKIEIHFVKNFEVDMTDTIRNFLDGINNGFSDTNDLLDALKTLMDDVNDMIANIRQLETKIENATYLPRLYKYLDKIANSVGKYTPMLFKPALFFNSDEGFGIVGVNGAPTTISSTKVTLFPTTYSGEICAPIFKKYIRVNGGTGQIVDGNTVTVTLKKGLNKIEYYALDYQAKQYPEAGNESAGEYYIYVK